MIKAIADKWCAALRSGEYNQGYNALRTEKDGRERYCCLGVLCDLAMKNGVLMTLSLNGEYDGMGAYLPEAVTDWSGVRKCSPEVNIFRSNRDTKLTLSCLNDSKTSFEDIAKLIETNIENL